MKTNRSLPSRVPQLPLVKQQGNPKGQTSDGGSANGPVSKNWFQSGFEPSSAPPSEGLAARGLSARHSGSIPDQDPQGETKPPQRGSGQGSDEGNRTTEIE